MIIFQYKQKKFQFDLDTLEQWMSSPLKERVFNLKNAEQMEAAFDLVVSKAGLTSEESDTLGMMRRYEFEQLFIVQ